MKEQVSIGECCEKKISTLASSYRGLIDYIDISSVDNQEKRITGFQTIDSKEAPSRAKQVVQVGDILVSTVRPNLNAVARIEKNSTNMMIASTGYCVLRCNQSINNQYLFYFCQSPSFIGKMVSQATGASYPAVSASIVRNCYIPLPPMEKQKQIAAVLDKVSTLISLRKQQLAKLDELVKARFVEMFGDPVVNTMGWETRAGEALFKLSNGKAVPEQRRFSSGVPAYGGNGISWFTDSSIIDHDTIVVGRVGFQSGNVHYAEGPLWVTDNAMFISNYKQEDCDLRFLYYLMEIMNFTRFQDDGDLKKITQKPFMRAKYILPPLYLQKQYISDVEVYDRNSELIKLSLDKLETLKNALMQEYF